MPDEPMIAIFADSPAVAAYLRHVLAMGGYEAVEGSVVSTGGIAATLIIAATDRAFTLAPGQKILRLLDRTEQAADEEGIRFLKTPMKAAAMLDHIRQMLQYQTASSTKVSIGDGVLDTRDSLWIDKGGQTVRLTEKEVALLSLLHYAVPSPVPKHILLEKVWAYVDGVETHTLETHIYRLRQKIEADPSTPRILLTTGDGYTVAP